MFYIFEYLWSREWNWRKKYTLISLISPQVKNLIENWYEFTLIDFKLPGIRIL